MDWKKSIEKLDEDTATRGNNPHVLWTEYIILHYKIILFSMNICYKLINILDFSIISNNLLEVAQRYTCCELCTKIKKVNFVDDDKHISIIVNATSDPG